MNPPLFLLKGRCLISSLVLYVIKGRKKRELKGIVVWNQLPFKVLYLEILLGSPCSEDNERKGGKLSN